ncbi:TIGR03086 family metal-binding protein [Gordonia polyisoprenivorans]|uniref:TIGR03086 family metal-binding protein n=1 Tax=Gordonia polyisoprenivorans TaxID=84595 RepID=UPI000B99EDE6|nr:TIGR03086 family metal-binding protein [Gordonia polyisoprenivorans]OZC29247.1 TIGR03086 family protein [Gordonia polyisoprenivorans]
MSRGLAELSASDRHRDVAAGFAEHVAAVKDWDAPTPVDGWVTRDVVAHLVDWFAAFLAAGDVELPAGPQVADDPAAAWDARRAAVQQLLDGPDAEATFTHPMVGELRLADAIDRFYTTDIFLHTWDLATAAGRDPQLDTDFAAQVYSGMQGIEDMLRSSGQYGPAMPVPADADPVTRLAGFIGRDPAWRPIG